MSTIKVNRIENTATTDGGIDIDSSGNCGVGTSSPSTALDVSGAISLGAVALPSAGTARIFSRNTDNALYLQTASGNRISLLDGSQNSMASFESTAVKFYISNSEKARFDSSGTLLIGATSQIYGGSKLEVADTDNAIQYIYNTDVSASGVATLAFGPSNGITGSQIKCIATEDFSTSANRTADLTFETRKDGTLSEKMRIDSSANIKITFPDGNTGLRNKISFVTESPHQDETAFIAANRTAVSSAPTDLVFATGTASGASERMRLSSGGSLFINRTTAVNQEKFSVGNGGQVAYFRCTVNANHDNIQMSHSYATGGQTATQISIQNAALSQVGSIKSTASSTSFNTSSDYRLKENVVDIADGITRIKQLLPKRFNFIVNVDKTVDGFLAHEAQAVVPEAVTGEKDGEEMQGIDQAKLVPLLTAALQEAISKIETLETQHATLLARVTALEAA